MRKLKVDRLIAMLRAMTEHEFRRAERFMQTMPSVNSLVPVRKWRVIEIDYNRPIVIGGEG